jgi:hypothetical protein
MQKKAILKGKGIMPNQGHECCKNYTCEGFVNKTNKNKAVSKVEQIKEKKSCIINNIALSEKHAYHHHHHQDRWHLDQLEHLCCCYLVVSRNSLGNSPSSLTSCSHTAESCSSSLHEWRGRTPQAGESVARTHGKVRITLKIRKKAYRASILRNEIP